MSDIRAALERLLDAVDGPRYDAFESQAAIAAARAALAAEPVGEGPILQWTENMPPSEGCRYDHCTAETLFGRFLISWKGWKQFDSPTVDETPWGDWYGAFNSVDAAKIACQKEMDERLARWGRPATPVAPEPGGEGPSDQDLYDLADVFNDDPVPAMRRALELWGHPATPPAPEPGEVGELVAHLHVIAKLERIACRVEAARTITRAATLLQQQAAPAPDKVVIRCPETCWIEIRRIADGKLIYSNHRKGSLVVPVGETPAEPPAPAGGLVEGLAGVWSHGQPLHPAAARAAIREVAEWLDERGCHGCSLWLREEADRCL